MRLAGSISLLLGLAAAPGSAQAPARAYLLYVASESADEVTLLRFTPGRGLEVEKVIPVGFLPTEIEGPHGLAVAPDGGHWYVTLAHGLPAGWMVKYAAGADTAEGRVELGMFPSTLAVAPFGRLGFTVNSDFHGDPVPSTLSVLDLTTMAEVARTTTCTTPHGSRFTSDGTRHYSTCVRDDQLVETDARTFQVARRLVLTPPAAPPGASADETVQRAAAGDRRCSPTWAQPSPDGALVYVACNRSDEIIEVNARTWQVRRRWTAPKGPYNLEVTPDGSRLVVTQKQGGAVSVWELGTARRLALVPSTRRVTHGVAITPDARYAFVSAEGVGGEPGAVDVIDLRSLEKVATADVGKQAGGIAIWKVLR